MINKEKIINEIEKIVGEKNIIFNEDELMPFNKDWRGFYNFKSICCTFPENTNQIQQLLKFCYHYRIKVVPQGGNTSLTGASVPSSNNNEVIINLKKMNKIISLDKQNYIITLEAGCVLDDIKTFVKKNNLYFPLTLTSSGSCQIGGNIATNAGGINVLKYGSIKDSIIGLEVVMADGSLMNALSSMKKNNTGYDLKNIFCGSEGTLGIISKAILKVFPLPNNYFHCFVASSSTYKSVEIFNCIQNKFGDQLESAELIPHIAFDMCIKHNYINSSFFQKNHESYLLCKFALFDNKNLFEEKFSTYILNKQNIYKEIIIPQSIQQEINLWKFRDDLVDAYKLEGKHITNDISLPIEKLSNFFTEATKLIEKKIKNTRIFAFGHLGDGNIHFNLIEPENYQDNFNKHRKNINNLINNLVVKYGGSFSAEHGIGMFKKDALLKFKNSKEIDLMKKIKESLDPNNILNPGKIFDLN